MRRYIKFSSKKISWFLASDIKKRIKHLVSTLGIDWVEPSRIFCMRSENANTRAYARIWGLGRIWQQALGIEAAYIVEVISEKFDRLDDLEKDKVLLHEITHIPRNFSGSLLPHIRRGKRRFEDRVHVLIAQYLDSLRK